MFLYRNFNPSADGLKFLYTQEGSGGLGILPWWKNRSEAKPSDVRNRRFLKNIFQFISSPSGARARDYVLFISLANLFNSFISA